MRLERQAKERFSREKDVLIAEKFNLEQQLAVSLLNNHFNIPTIQSIFMSISRTLAWSWI